MSDEVVKLLEFELSEVCEIGESKTFFDVHLKQIMRFMKDNGIERKSIEEADEKDGQKVSKFNKFLKII